jgi:peptide/nickel transport system substrate-binding protein
MGIAAITLVATAACGGGTNSPTASNSGGVGGGANATFTYDTYTTVMTGWDPSTSYSNEIIAMSNMYETLTRYDDSTQTVKPLLATSWQSSDQGKTWTFELRHGVTFHTGRPMTAQAAKAAIERTIKLNQGAAYIWGAVRTIETPSPDTLVFHLKYAAPLDLISSADYAAYIYDTKAAGSADLGKWFAKGHDAGTGPYTAVKWQQGQEIEVTLGAYPKYWDGWSGSHYKRVVFRVVPQATTAAQLLQSKQVSFVEQLTPQLWQSMSGDSAISRTSRASWQNLFAFFNTANGPMSDQRLRKAVSYGINYNGILAALKGAGTRTPGIVPNGLIGYSGSLPTYGYDQAKAKALLAEAGYGPGEKALDLTMTYTSGDSNEQLVATLMKSSLAPLNINLTTKALQWPTQWAQAKSSNISARQDIFMMYWWPDYADPYSWFINLFRTEKTPVFNLDYYSNPALDKQIDGVESVLAVSKDQAAQMYYQMQRELYDAAPAVVLYTANYQRALLSSVKGYVDNPAYPNVVFAYDLQPTGS